MGRCRNVQYAQFPVVYRGLTSQFKGVGFRVLNKHRPYINPR